MTLNTKEINALLEVFSYCRNWEELSELIEYDVYKLRAKLMSEMMLQSSYDLECE